MFLPPDLTSSERDLVETLTIQLLAHRCPSSPAEEQAVRHEASEVAAEMIFESRAATLASAVVDNEDVTDGTDEDLESGYLRRLRRTLERDQEISRLEAAEMDGLDLPDRDR